MKNSQEGFRIFLTMKIIKPEKQKRLKKSEQPKGPGKTPLHRPTRCEREKEGQENT